MKANLPPILRVNRSKAQAKASYDRMSKSYDLMAGVYERKYSDMAFKQLKIAAGETVLEIGFGTGYHLKQMANAVGEHGKVCGIDLSTGMLAVSRKRLEKSGLWNRVELTCGDAGKLPYEDNKFDAVFMSFTLELFDVPDIPIVLAEIMRVLKSNGRFGIISMSKANGTPLLLRLYEWMHREFPNYIDCRPIYVEQSLKDAGFKIQHKDQVSIWGLPGDIVIGTNPIAPFLNVP